MRISEMIAKLQEAMAEHGDIHVAVAGREIYYEEPDISEVAPLVRDWRNAGWHTPPHFVQGPAAANLALPHLIIQ